MQKITPNLWFDNQAQEAVQFYTSLFKNSRVLLTMKKLDLAKIRQAYDQE